MVRACHKPVWIESLPYVRKCMRKRTRLQLKPVKSQQINYIKTAFEDIQKLPRPSKFPVSTISTMLQNYSVLQTLLTAFTPTGLTTPSSEHIHHLHARQGPSGPANRLPEVLGKYEYLSTYTSILNVRRNSVSGPGSDACSGCVLPADNKHRNTLRFWLVPRRTPSRYRRLLLECFRSILERL